MRIEIYEKMILLNSNSNYYKEDLMKKIKKKQRICNSHKMYADKAAYEILTQNQFMYLI